MQRYLLWFLLFVAFALSVVAAWYENWVSVVIGTIAVGVTIYMIFFAGDDDRDRRSFRKLWEAFEKSTKPGLPDVGKSRGIFYAGGLASVLTMTPLIFGETDTDGKINDFLLALRDEFNTPADFRAEFERLTKTIEFERLSKAIKPSAVLTRDIDAWFSVFLSGAIAAAIIVQNTRPEDRWWVMTGVAKEIMGLD